jgi:hypothetical protein
MSNQWYGKFGNSRVSFMNQKLKAHHFELGEKTKIKNFLKREVQSLLYVSVIDSPQKVTFRFNLLIGVNWGLIDCLIFIPQVFWEHQNIES